MGALSLYGLASMAIANTAQKSPIQRLTIFGASLLGRQLFPAVEAQGLPLYYQPLKAKKEHRKKLMKREKH